MQRGAMGRAMILRHLTRARERVAQGERHLKLQQQIVDVLQRDGRNAPHARKLLQKYQELQARHIADRDRLERDLSDPGVTTLEPRVSGSTWRTRVLAGRTKRR